MRSKSAGKHTTNNHHTLNLCTQHSVNKTAKKKVVDLLGIEPRTAPNFFNQKMLRENYTTKPQARG